MIKALIFDFGGTLDTDGVHWSEKFKEVIMYYVKSMTTDDINKAYLYSENLIVDFVKQNDSFKTTLNRQIALQIKYFIENNLLDENKSNKLILDISNYCYSDVLNKIKMVNHILQKLILDYKLAIVSNFYGNLETVLKELSIHHFFNSIVDSSIVNIRKPNPLIFKIAIDSLSLYPNECIVIGDSYERDIIPAKQLGCKTIWLKGKSWCYPTEISSADFIIKSLSELPGLISQKIFENLLNKN